MSTVPRIKPYLMIPLGIALILLLWAGQQGVERMQQAYLQREIDHYRSTAVSLLKQHIENDANLLGATLETLAGNEALMAAFSRGDRDALQAMLAPVYPRLRDVHGITHLYFSGADRVNLLRVHDPKRHGDVISRHTTLEAERTGRTAWGAELGPLGLFTLRVVRPVFQQGRLLGYLEVGEEIEHLTRQLREALGADLFVAIDKHHLDRGKWEAGMALLGRQHDWNRLPDRVIINGTAPLSQEVLDALSQPETGLAPPQQGLQTRLLLPLPLLDASGNDVGRLLLRFDTSALTAEATRSTRLITHLGATLAAALFLLCYLLLGRVEKRIHTATSALTSQEALFRSVLDSAGEGIFGIDLDGRCTFVNPAGLRLLGYDQASDLLGRDMHALSHHSHADGHPYPAEHCRIRDAHDKPEGVSVDDEVFFRADGRAVPVEYHAYPLRQAGQLIGVVVTFEDITDKKHAQERLRLAATVYESGQEGMTITDPDARIIGVNQAFTRITGYSEAEVLGKDPGILKSGRHGSEFYHGMWRAIRETGHWQGEIWNRRKDGEIYPEWLVINSVLNEHEALTHYVAVFSDISRAKESEAKLEHLAHYDPLTDLPNRVLLQSRLEHAISHASRLKHRIGLLFLDLDRFKDINDSLGHPAGDELLIAFARRLSGRIRAEDTLARLGGDEFVVVLESLAEPQNAATLAQDIQALLAQPFHLAGHDVYIDASIGISIYPDDAEDATRLFRNADAAMYQAKASGKNTYRFYTEALTQAANERLALEASLRQALERGEFLLHYQPQVDTRSEQIVGVEALVRWNRPGEGMISPARFIPVAEQTGLIVPLGEWILRAACEQMKRWQDAGLPQLTLAVNISAHQFRQPGLVSMVADILAKTDIPPASLELELTESAIMEQAEEAIATLRQLKGLGVQLAIDDFGTGYSSLAYLKRFPVDKLKIDQSFVRDIPQDRNDAEIAATIIAMAKNLQLKVLAEGVETEAQLAFLKAHGCDIYQGYLFSRPVPPEAIDALLQATGKT